ncbi:hypothetical protein HaLaN_27083 [Haematococcus lacustris]|uniref:Uncharacterized protein n=1 Tax=Haematococcus lacustris TaxID=44745 RepID=A0A6A0A7U3_HAELA|nr:hypothetical protein HaLaN_27083 [Haematococcus lacustris]
MADYAVLFVEPVACVILEICHMAEKMRSSSTEHGTITIASSASLPYSAVMGCLLKLCHSWLIPMPGLFEASRMTSANWDCCVARVSLQRRGGTSMAAED